MEKAKLILLGVLIGAILATALPSGAHHRDSVSTLKQRVSELEYLTRHIDPVQGEYDPLYIDRRAGCSFGDVVTWESSGIGC